MNARQRAQEKKRARAKLARWKRRHRYKIHIHWTGPYKPPPSGVFTGFWDGTPSRFKHAKSWQWWKKPRGWTVQPHVRPIPPHAPQHTPEPPPHPPGSGPAR